MSLMVPKSLVQHFFSVTNTSEFAINAILFSWQMHHQYDAYDEIHVLNAASNIRDGTRADIFQLELRCKCTTKKLEYT